jgi:hypothetical protein
MKILITGIGCIGKSSLRERLALEFRDNVISVDMDYNREIPSESDKVVLVESVHGLEENPQMFDKILYLLPPHGHIILWLKRAWAWFSTGIVDLSAPKGKRKRFAISNIPIILKILMRNIFRRRSWIRADVALLEHEFSDNSCIASSIWEGYGFIKFWITKFIENGEV